MPATVKDIARLTGVSPATVSRVTSGQRCVSAAVRNRVLSAISQLQYTPNEHAAKLASERPRHSKVERTQLSSSAYKQMPRLNQRRLAVKPDSMDDDRLRALEVDNLRLQRLVRKLGEELDRWRTVVG